MRYSFGEFETWLDGESFNWSNDQFVLQSNRYSLSPAIDMELREDVTDVETDGRTADNQPFGDFDIVETFNHQSQDLFLTSGQVVAQCIISRVGGGINQTLSRFGGQSRSPHVSCSNSFSQIINGDIF